MATSKKPEPDAAPASDVTPEPAAPAPNPAPVSAPTRARPAVLATTLIAVGALLVGGVAGGLGGVAVGLHLDQGRPGFSLPAVPPGGVNGERPSDRERPSAPNSGSSDSSGGS